MVNLRMTNNEDATECRVGSLCWYLRDIIVYGLSALLSCTHRERVPR